LAPVAASGPSSRRSIQARQSVEAWGVPATKGCAALRVRVPRGLFVSPNAAMFGLGQSLSLIWSGPGLALIRSFERRCSAKREDGFPFLASWRSGGSLGRPCISFPVEERRYWILWSEPIATA
jgi:hypothetical protein